MSIPNGMTLEEARDFVDSHDEYGIYMIRQNEYDGSYKTLFLENPNWAFLESDEGKSPFPYFKYEIHADAFINKLENPPQHNTAYPESVAGCDDEENEGDSVFSTKLVKNSDGTLRVSSGKDTNPKDSIGTKKWRQITTVSMPVMLEVGVGMLEGAKKYGRHNYRVSDVRASVYIDAAIGGHLIPWWEGEDTDADSALSHITKAICSLVVLRDAMIQGKLIDDRPPKTDMQSFRNNMQEVVDQIFEKYPEGVPPYTEQEWGEKS